MTDTAIGLEGVGKRFGRVVALDHVGLEVPRGSIYALLGHNGAGKTTLVRLLLGQLRPDAGRVVVLGENPAAAPRAVLSRTGYLPERSMLYGWMRVDEAVRFHAGFHERWDADLVTDLLGQRPDLLLLDDPTSGLDAVVRRDLLTEMIRRVHGAGGTVLMATHLIDDAERLADRVAFLREGRIVIEGELENLKARFRRLRAAFDEPPDDLAEIPGVVRAAGGRHLELTTLDWTEDEIDDLRARGARLIEPQRMRLEEIFLALMRPESSLPSAGGGR